MYGTIMIHIDPLDKHYDSPCESEGIFFFHASVLVLRSNLLES